MLKESIVSFFSGIFQMPNIQGKQYAPGWQPNSPGESSTPGWPGASMQLKPWPNMVQTINALANNPGTPHSRAPVPVNDAYSLLPSNYLFIAGVVEKSQG